jgi:hypothetical protein
VGGQVKAWLLHDWANQDVGEAERATAQPLNAPQQDTPLTFLLPQLSETWWRWMQFKFVTVVVQHSLTSQNLGCEPSSNRRTNRVQTMADGADPAVEAEEVLKEWMAQVPFARKVRNGYTTISPSFVPVTYPAPPPLSFGILPDSNSPSPRPFVISLVIGILWLPCISLVGCPQKMGMLRGRDCESKDFNVVRSAFTTRHTACRAGLCCRKWSVSKTSHVTSAMESALQK